MPPMFDNLKKRGAKWVLLHLIKKGIAMTRITIDRQKKTMEAELDIEGEAAPIHMQAEYAFEKLVDGEGMISLSKIRVSKKWLQFVAKVALAGKKVPLPTEVAEFAELML
jgi:hypothetical protein